MASSLASSPFNFQTVRQLQQSCFDVSESYPFSSTDNPLLLQVTKVVSESRYKEALTLIDQFVNENDDTDTSSLGAAAAPDSINSLLHRALLIRADVHLKMRNLTLAKRDVERAIMMKPKYVDAYRLLSAVESQRGQMGRAEVALVLGLRVDESHAELRKKLAEIQTGWGTVIKF